MDPPVAISAVGVMEDRGDRLLESAMTVWLMQSPLVVEERGPCQAGRGEQVFEPVFSLEIDDDSDSQPRCVFLKARNFPKYATSARSFSFSRRRRWTSSISDSLGAGGRPLRAGWSASGP